MMLGRKQEIFSRCLSSLLVFAHNKGYEIRMGEVERSVEEKEKEKQKQKQKEKEKEKEREKEKEKVSTRGK